MTSSSVTETRSHLLDVREAAEQLHVRPRWIEDQVRSGSLPHLKLGHLTRIRQSDLDEYVAGLVRRKQ